MNSVTSWLDGWNVGGKTSIIWFVLLAVALVFFALKIVKNANVLSTKSRFGGGIIGGILIAVVSAAPEFITSIQQSLAGDPGAATADDIGSNAIAGLLIGVGALLFLRETFLNRLKKWTIISLWISFTVSLIVTLVLVFKADVWLGSAGKFVIGIVPLAQLIVYFVLLWAQSKYGDDDEHVTDTDYIENTSIKKASWLFVMWGILLISASILINFAVISVEDGYNINQQSAGGLFLALAMALPEGVAFFAMLKNKQYAAAVAILIGHGFALYVSEFLADAAYVDNATYKTQQVHDVWPIAVLSTIILGLIGTSALLGKKFKVFKKKKVYAILPTLILLTYIVGWILILTLYY